MEPEISGSRLGARLLRTRAFVRAPIPLYRAGLGFLLGPRLLMLEHIGRKPGARRGVAATATPLTADESAAALARYAAEHPAAWKRLRATIEQATGAPVDNLPMMLLRLGPAGEPADRRPARHIGPATGCTWSVRDLCGTHPLARPSLLNAVPRMPRPERMR